MLNVNKSGIYCRPIQCLGMESKRNESISWVETYTNRNHERFSIDHISIHSHHADCKISAITFELNSLIKIAVVQLISLIEIKLLPKKKSLNYSNFCWPTQDGFHADRK